jgi:hypothetical protein
VRAPTLFVRDTIITAYQYENWGARAKKQALSGQIWAGMHSANEVIPIAAPSNVRF